MSADVSEGRKQETKERTDVMEVRKKKMRVGERDDEGGKGGDGDGEGIGGHLRKQKRQKTDRKREEEELFRKKEGKGQK